jgi:ribose-phosphate pyrophosphokinase
MSNEISVHTFAAERVQAEGLARALHCAVRPIDLHAFPDGESLVTASAPASTAVVYRPLHHPNAKLIEVILAASALREGGARRVVLVAPYLPYMRQDIAFAPGQAVSQRVMGSMIAPWFEGVVAVAPHLHRTLNLADVFPGRAALAVQPVEPMARLLRAEPDANRLLLAPDVEAQPLVQALAEHIGARYGSAMKRRHGDTEVELMLSGAAGVAGKNVVIVDDMVSTGHTLIAAARAALSNGAARVEALVAHAFFSEEAARALAEGGIHQIRSCDGVPHTTNAIPLAESLADAVRKVLGPMLLDHFAPPPPNAE